MPESDQVNNLFWGNFNLHVSEEGTDIDAEIFMETLEAMGLYQHIPFSTHRSGNTLDLIISEIGSNTRIKTTSAGPFTSNHWAVISVLTAKRDNLKQQNRVVQKMSKITTDQWNDFFNSDNIKPNTNLKGLVNSFECELKRILDELAPEVKCTVLLKPRTHGTMLKQENRSVW